MYIGLPFSTYDLEVYEYDENSHSFKNGSSACLLPILEKTGYYFYDLNTLYTSNQEVLILPRQLFDELDINNFENPSEQYDFFLTDNAYVSYTSDLSQVDIVDSNGIHISTNLQNSYDLSRQYQDLYSDNSSNFAQMKIINIDKQCLYPDLSTSPDQNYFAINGDESKYILIRNTKTFDLKNTVNIIKNKLDKSIAKKICLINKNLLGVALNNCSIRFYSLGKYEGIFIKEIKDVHIKGINKFICSNNLVVVVFCVDKVKE